MSKSQSGFTLVELVVTVSVLAILLAIGLPNFAVVLRSNRLAARTNEFITAVSLARSQAIKTNTNATVCASADGATCGGGDWNTGWIVFTDTNANGAVDAGDTLLQVTTAAPKLSFTATPVAAPTLTFDSSGLYTGAAAVAFQMLPIDCPSGYDGRRDLTLLKVGQLTMTNGACP